MKKIAHQVFIIVCSISLVSWGFYGHRTINHAAVFTLPTEMFGFYKKHIDYIREMAVNADKRRYAVADEAAKHFLDADFYEKSAPLDTLPHHWDSAVAKYGLDTVMAHGIVPWQVIKMKYWLTDAFKKRDFKNVLRLSADLGHYVADLHVPLHSTHNYDGQLSGQEGIHGLWESRLPELFGQNYDLFVGKARYINQLDSEVWVRFEQSFAAKDSVLLLEKLATQYVKESNKYTFETRGRQTVKTYSEKFSSHYHEKLNDMVEKRMQASIEFVGSIWFTAWVDAGQPDLNEDANFEPYIPDENLDSIYLNSKIIGRPETE
ncbi:MAG: S1/P1 Nuclease [Flavobacteriales bacterium]|nr:S1/P1 Nuclease [Flavobacteriales bacterium]